MSYKAIVCRIKVFPHPNADNLVIGKVGNYQVIVSKDTVDDQLGIYFGSDGQLSQEFAEANDLIARVGADGKRAGGYFGKNRRVTAQNFRNEKSEGFWCPVSFLNFITLFDLTSLKDGDQFDEINGVKICGKYYTPATARAIGNKQGKLRKKNPFFLEHIDTKQLKHEIKQIPAGARISISEKVHGTSQRQAYVPDTTEKYLNIVQRVFRYLSGDGFDKVRTATSYKELLGTRRTILKTEDQPGYYENEDFRHIVAKSFAGKMHKHEEWFYEVVGFTTTGAPIMSVQATEKLKDKSITKQYGSTMLYKYGCLQGTCDIYVYRIAIVNGDGISFDLPKEQVIRRCEEIGVKYVPELCNEFIYDGDADRLLNFVGELIEGPSTIDNSHIAEGVVVRTETASGVTFYKAKSHTFGRLEGYLKDEESFVDLEEIS